MASDGDEERLLHSVALQNAASILQARQRAEAELTRAKQQLEARTAELAQSLSTLRATLESTTDAIVVTDASGRIADRNEKLLELWELSPSDLSGRDWPWLAKALARAASDPRRFAARVQEIDARPAEDSFDLVELADGRVIEQFSRVLTVEGRAQGRVWSFRDVTERRRYEQALETSHAQFSAIIEQSPVAILLLDGELRIRQANPKALPAFPLDPLGHRLEELLESFQLSPPPQAILERCRRTLETGEPDSETNFVSIRKDRSAPGYFDWNLRRIVLPTGELGLVCYFTDVTEHVLAQQALRESEQRLRATFEQAAVGMALASFEGRFLKVNRKFTEILGYSAEELCERTFVDITHPEDVALSVEHVRRLQAREIHDCAYEKRYVRKDGSLVWSLTTVALLDGLSGQAPQFIGVIDDITARKRAEEALRENAQRLQLALSAGHLGDWSWDAASDRLTLGERALGILCFPAGAVPTWRELRARMDPEERERDRKAVERALLRRQDYANEFRLKEAGPGERWVAAQGRGVYAPDGSVLGMIGVVQEVSERKRLEEMRRRLAAVVESSDDAILSKDLDGTIRTWNSGAEHMFDYSAEEVIGRDVTMLLPQERWDEERQILRRLRGGERLEGFESERIRKGGERFPVSLTLSPIRDERGSIVGVSTIARDISERKRAEEVLREESRVLNLLNDTGKSIAADLDLQALVQRVTDAATQLSNAAYGAFFYNVSDHGVAAFELFALSGAPREEFQKLGNPRATPLFLPTFQGQGPIRCEDVRSDPRFGQMAPHHGPPPGHLPVRSYLAVPVVSRTAEVIGGLFFGHPQPGVFTDKVERLVVGVAAQAAIAIDNARLYERVKRLAEERKELLDAERTARAEVERASFLKDEFLATLSHELRTPLNAIVGWAQVLRTRGHTDGELLEGLGVIDRNARIQAQLIEDLLDMSRILSGKVRLDVQRVELSEVVDAAVASVRPSAESKGIRLQALIDPLAGPVWGDPNRLQQCVWNLLTNAIKFTPKGGKVVIALSRVNSHLEIEVADTGQGIGSDFLPFVFEKFRQADASTTRHHGGLGLGLSIVKSLVELHGGSVRASSPGKDQGSTFTIELPVMVIDSALSGGLREHPRASANPPAIFDRPSLAGVKVLAVDDEADARVLIRRVLEDCGASVVVAGSAQEALAVLARERPDMIVSDIGMPEEDGYELIRKVRALPPELGGRTPAAALSAFARAEDRTRALRAGFHTHVAKPVEPAELAAVVASLALRR